MHYIFLKNMTVFCTSAVTLSFRHILHKDSIKYAHVLMALFKIQNYEGVSISQ